MPAPGPLTGRESRVQKIIREARATLMNPTRPQTPNDSERSFYLKGLSSRQGTPISLQPLSGGTFSTERPDKGTPAVGKAKAAVRNQYWPDSPVDLGLSASPPEFPCTEAGEDPRWGQVRALIPLLDPEHSLETLKEAVDKVGQVTDQLVSSIPLDTLSKDPRMRALVARIQKLEDLEDPLLLLRCGRVMLLVNPGGPFLLGTIKVLYKASKASANDTLFRSERLLEPLLNLLHPERGEAVSLDVQTLVAGILKNVSDSADIQRSLGTFGAIRVLTAVCQEQMTELLQQQPEGGVAPRTRVDLLIQATGALRNLSLLSAHSTLFVKLGTIEAIYPSAFNGLRGFRDIVLNSSRILSKLSHHEECRAVLNRDPGNLAHVVDTMEVYKDQRAIAVRLAFTLGNLVQTNETNRVWMGCKLPGCLDTILAVFLHHCAVDQEVMEQLAESGWPPEVDDDDDEGDDGSTDATSGPDKGPSTPPPKQPVVDSKLKALNKARKDSEEVLIRLVRLVANLSISSEVGPFIATNSKAVDGVVGLLKRKHVHQSEELVLNTVCCITNLSFYPPHDTLGDNAVLSQQYEIGEVIAMLLMHDHVDAVVESARAFGNFSRDSAMREWMMQNRVDEACAILVDHSDKRVVYAVCGVLLNFSADSNHVKVFHQYDLIENLNELVKVVETSDLELLSLIFKIFYNLGDKNFFSPDHATMLHDYAASLLEAARQLGPGTPGLDEFDEVCSNVLDVLTHDDAGSADRRSVDSQ